MTNSQQQNIAALNAATDRVREADEVAHAVSEWPGLLLAVTAAATADAELKVLDATAPVVAADARRNTLRGLQSRVGYLMSLQNAILRQHGEDPEIW